MQLLGVAERVFLPPIFPFCVVGAYAVNNGFFDVGIVILFGILRYLIRKSDYEPAASGVAFVLCSTLEQSMRQSLRLSGANSWIFFIHPISTIFLIII
jgi:putative tricarboxylic transport membrane protein